MKLAELVPLSHKFAKQSRVGIFCNDATDPLHWTQNSYFGYFRPFHYCMEVDAKLAELLPLLHKFAKRSRVRIFRNESTRSTPLDRKLNFWGVSDRFITARKSM
jgi:hypothetical protein